MAAELVLVAEKRGVLIDQTYAMNFIDAKQRLNAHPDDEIAKQRVQHFELLMSPVGRFTLPEEDWFRSCLPLVQS